MPIIPATWEEKNDHEFKARLGKVSKTLSQKQKIQTKVLEASLNL
jgi:hypothetical protein